MSHLTAFAGIPARCSERGSIHSSDKKENSQSGVHVCHTTLNSVLGQFRGLLFFQRNVPKCITDICTVKKPN